MVMNAHKLLTSHSALHSTIIFSGKQTRSTPVTLSGTIKPYTKFVL